ncbi:MAG: signal peptidase I [Saprospiraceae bacterium]|nr:signal peptidase I [Saprospiraceae bacterium]
MLIFLLISYLLLSISLYFVFNKAGEAGWKGLVPGLNFAVWAKLIGRKERYALWLLFPVVNIFIYAGMCIDLVRCFGKHSFLQAVGSVVYAPASFFLIGKNKEDQYAGPIVEQEKAYYAQIEEARKSENARQLKKLEANNPFKKGPAREWAEAIIFAVFAAAFIRMFLIEAYVIPTPSMEGTLLVGDYLFVSKAHYGIRTPKTVLMIPLLHNRIPVLNRESYLEKPNLPFWRLPALEKIDRNDLVVFNYPEGDSIYLTPSRAFSVYDVRRNPGLQSEVRGRQLITRPVDKKDHYIKRCVAIAGDTLQIRDGQLYINGAISRNPEKIQFLYKVTYQGQLNTSVFEDWGILGGPSSDIASASPGLLYLHLNNEQVELIKGMDPSVQVERVDIASVRNSPNMVFPYDLRHNQDWTIDNYGPLYVPKKGASIPLNEVTVNTYRRCIEVYEGNSFQISGGKYLINGQEATSYTFTQDYYWMMGDNRHNSEDSRIWGFVPADHVVGKPLFIWFSTKNGSMSNGINWNRIFRKANNYD